MEFLRVLESSWWLIFEGMCLIKYYFQKSNEKINLVVKNVWRSREKKFSARGKKPEKISHAIFKNEKN